MLARGAGVEPAYPGRRGRNSNIIHQGYYSAVISGVLAFFWVFVPERLRTGSDTALWLLSADQS